MNILFNLAKVYSQTGLWYCYLCYIPGDFPLNEGLDGGGLEFSKQ